MLLVQPQGFHKPLPQAGEEVQRAPQKDNFPLQGPSLGESRYRLIHHRLKDGGRYVLLAAPLIEDGLNVALGEHAAPGGNGVNLFML